jgi:GntR family transcriptional regulator / MocR family aminotransferase
MNPVLESNLVNLEFNLEHGSKYHQLYAGLQTAILSQQLPAGTRLPASRRLAAQLGVSRNTVVAAFEQLTAEGYLEARVGDGSFVALQLPEQIESTQTMIPQAEQPTRALSQRGQALSRIRVSASNPHLQTSGAFITGTPAQDSFPFALWSKLEADAWKTLPQTPLFGYADPAGYLPLRRAIATYLSLARGVCCTDEQVIVTTGSQQGLDLVARVLTDPKDAVWLEDPGYIGARGAFMAAQATVVAVPVDGQGLCVQAGIQRAPKARLAMVTPSHQYPMGVSMSVSRRLELLEWANQSGAWILEDDYNSEYRYAGRPLPSLQGLDNDQRVIYLGTFSKVLMPGLRLGYLVVPSDLTQAFVNARALLDRHSNASVQVAMTRFMAEGHFARHIRRHRKLYAERQAMLFELFDYRLGTWCKLEPNVSGMHLLCHLPEGIDDVMVAKLAAREGVIVMPLSGYCLERTLNGLVLGYTHLTRAEMIRGVEGLKRALQEAQRLKRH